MGVPGAGGFDAVFVLLLGGDSKRMEIENYWEKNHPNVCALMLSDEKSISIEEEEEGSNKKQRGILFYT